MPLLAFLNTMSASQKFIVPFALIVALSGCSTHHKETGYTTQHEEIEAREGYFVNPSFKASAQNERVRFLIMHYTALDDNRSLKALT